MTRLTIKALRHYDELGLLTQASVDSGLELPLPPAEAGTPSTAITPPAHRGSCTQRPRSVPLEELLTKVQWPVEEHGA